MILRSFTRLEKEYSSAKLICSKKEKNVIFVFSAQLELVLKCARGCETVFFGGRKKGTEKKTRKTICALKGSKTFSQKEELAPIYLFYFGDIVYTFWAEKLWTDHA